MSACHHNHRHHHHHNRHHYPRHCAAAGLRQKDSRVTHVMCNGHTGLPLPLALEGIPSCQQRQAGVSTSLGSFPFRKVCTYSPGCAAYILDTLSKVGMYLPKKCRRGPACHALGPHELTGRVVIVVVASRTEIVGSPSLHADRRYHGSCCGRLRVTPLVRDDLILIQEAKRASEWTASYRVLFCPTRRRPEASLLVPPRRS